MPWKQDRDAARLTDVAPTRCQALSAVFDVLLSPGAVTTHAAPLIEPFVVREGMPARRLLAVEQVPRIALLDLSTAGRPRHAVYVDDDIVQDGSSLPLAVDTVSALINAHVLRTARDFFVVHAGAVVAPDGGAVLLAAASGAGKSSLTAALVRAGYPYLSDEFAAIDPVRGALHGYPKPLTIKGAARSLFPDVVGVPPTERPGEWFVAPESLGGMTACGVHSVRYVVLPQWRAGAQLSVLPLSRAELVVALGEHALGTLIYGDRGLDVLVRLVDGVRGVRLEYGTTADALRAVAELAGPAR